MTLKPAPISSKYTSSLVRVLDAECHAVNLDLIVLRDKKLQKDRQRFRQALYNIGYDIGREITQELIKKDLSSVCVETCLGFAGQITYTGEPVLLNILRASNPMWEGMQNAFPLAETGFVAASRDHGNVRADGSLGVSIDYLGVPGIKDGHLIIVDPMLATGSSIIDIYNKICILQSGRPSKTSIASAIAAPEGVKRVLENIPNSRIITASLDTHLNEKGYIIPGLGDAGDLCFGTKYGE